MSKKPAVVAKTAPKKRGRPLGAKSKTISDFPLKTSTQKPIDWKLLCNRLQAALAEEMRENDILEAELIRKRTFFERLVCLTTGNV
jgi:hypothetical protein